MFLTEQIFKGMKYWFKLFHLQTRRGGKKKKKPWLSKLHVKLKRCAGGWGLRRAPPDPLLPSISNQARACPLLRCRFRSRSCPFHARSILRGQQRQKVMAPGPQRNHRRNDPQGSSKSISAFLQHIKKTKFNMQPYVQNYLPLPYFCQICSACKSFLFFFP